MKFTVIRTTQIAGGTGDKNEKPCENAYRNEDSDGWYVNFTTLEELVAFVKNLRDVDEIVLNGDRIEIVDDWRE